MTIAARVLLLVVLVVPLAWSLYAKPKLGMDCTSSEVLCKFFAVSAPITLWVFGAMCWQLTLLAFPEIPWWKLAMLVWGGVLIGHCFWSR